MDSENYLIELARSVNALGVKRLYLRKPIYETLMTDFREEDDGVSDTDMAKSDVLQKERVKVEDCRGCDLYKTRANTVYSDGDIEANLMFVGEAPGAEEDKTGIPFVGRAGKLLDRILEDVGLKRSEVYICNTLKCRPPGNRDPLPEESVACSSFLHKQIEVVNPGIIVTLGLPAIRYFVPGKEAMGKLRSRVLEFNKRIIIPTYHPAAALRFPAYKEQIYEDIVKARDMMISGGFL